ncbi:putative protein transport membrane glycoprotein Sec20 [Aspergillus melleus]|uniref:putative protein transport membrane glycoprotein Sec20 n=1 Tax=Aspergillus melleus TaxID=138277 RepID=UPI001E8EC485|nr:Protein transport protein sec20 [Aspergillus melleus]KAH8426762.1 Protein transport protein sec20 [Aspergillus melleus]
MSSTSALQSRLKELSAALGRIHPLVSRLGNFTAAVGQGDEARLELGAEIHGLLKEAEEQLELLKVDVEALESGSDSRRKTVDNEKELERERIVAWAGRLTDDLKKTRGEFRNAQLQAKRNAELAKRKERELLFSRSQSGERQKQSNEKLTQDDITINASNDVTAALRRTHQLMQAELSRSQFAQETLEQSTAVLSSLSESYTGLDSLLSSSRNLIGSLLRSQKSDTWYLETAFYILVGTITWLLFRRILYGPLWWLLWLPLKLVFRFIFGILGVVGISSTAVQSSASITTSETLVQETPVVTPKAEPSVETAPSEAVWDQPPATEELDSDRMIDQIAEMVETSADHEETFIKEEPLPEESRTQDEPPRNTKKRMYEATEVLENRRDEL